MSQYDFIKNKCFFSNNIDCFVNKLVTNPNLLINFGWGNLNPRIIRDNLNIKLDKNIICQYGTSQGEKDLINNLICFLSSKSKVKIFHDNILMTNGATNASFLLAFYFKFFLDYKKVFLQNPTYDTAVNIFRSLGYQLESLRPDLSDLKGRIIPLAWIIFKYHNPTGLYIEEQQRKILRQEILRQGYLVEDDAYGLFHSESSIDLPQHKRHIYIGSFSKYIFPGLRMGYIIANSEIIKNLKEIQKYFNSHPNIISQAILSVLICKGNKKLLLADINRRKKDLEEKRNLFWSILSDKLKKNIFVNKGGFYYWIKLKTGVKTEKPFRELLRANILVIPGDIYFISNSYSAFRISISRVNREDIPKAVLKLNTILDKYL